MSAGIFHIHHIDNATHAPNQRWNIELENPLRAISTKVLEAVSSADLMEKAGLNWRVIEKSVRTDDGIPLPNHKALLRDDNGHVFGVVSKTFEPMQNAELFAFADSIVTQGKMNYVSAGQLKEGAHIFAQCVLRPDGDPIEIVPGDVVEPYFLLATGHDGTLATRALMTPQRVVCQNTFRYALSKKGNGKDSITIKHTAKALERLEQSKQMFGWALDSFKFFVEGAKASAGKQMSSEAKLKAFFREVFKVEGEEGNILEGDLSEKGQGAVRNRENRLCELFMEGAGQKNKYVRGTNWAALNAVTQYLDHEARTNLRAIVDLEKVAPDERLRLSATKRFESNLTGGGARIKARAFELATSV